MAAYTSYIVRQGDHLEKLAHVLGFDVAKLWDDPKNADLKTLRGDGAMLQPGDVLYLRAEPRPGLPIQKGTTNRYVATIPKIETRIKLADEKGPFAGEPFVVDGAGDHVEGTTDGEGCVVFEHLVTARVLTLRLPKRGKCMTLLVGDMDPLTEVSGIKKRLAHLGFFQGDINDRLDDATGAAVAVFQEKHGLPVTGTLDEATRDALRGAYGC